MSISNESNLSDMYESFFAAKKWAYSSYTPLSYFTRSTLILDYSQIKRKTND